MPSLDEILKTKCLTKTMLESKWNSFCSSKYFFSWKYLKKDKILLTDLQAWKFVYMYFCVALIQYKKIILFTIPGLHNSAKQWIFSVHCTFCLAALASGIVKCTTLELVKLNCGCNLNWLNCGCSWGLIMVVIWIEIWL